MPNIFDRLSQGMGAGSMQGNDINDWNDMVGSAPRERFGRSVYDGIRQVDPQDYYNHTQPGIGGTDPFGQLQSQERQGLAERMLGELFRRGRGQQDVMQGAGLRNLDPGSMSPAELAQLMQWTQRNDPKAFGRVAAEYQDKPNILESLLGNKGMMLALAGLGVKLMSDRRR